MSTTRWFVAPSIVPFGKVMAYVLKTSLSGFSAEENKASCVNTGGVWAGNTCTYQHSSDSMTDALRRGTCQGGEGYWSGDIGDGRDVCVFQVGTVVTPPAATTPVYTGGSIQVPVLQPKSKSSGDSLLLVSSILLLVGGVLLLKAGNK